MAIPTSEPSLHCSGEESPGEDLVLCGAGYIICSLYLQLNRRKSAEKHPKHETLCARMFSPLTLFLLFPSGLPLTLSAGSFLNFLQAYSWTGYFFFSWRSRRQRPLVIIFAF